MHKSLKILITSVTISSLVFSSAVSVKALTADEAYTYAYKATMDALNLKTQKSINNARVNIKALNGTSASWAIGEFSTKVDTVQHPILVKIIDAITLAQNTTNQSNINNAKNTIDSDLPIEWKSAYSSAVDSIQQNLMKEAVSLYNSAVSSKDKNKVNLALNKIQDIKTSLDTNIVNWAKEIESKLNSILAISQTVDNSLDKYTLSIEDSVRLYYSIQDRSEYEMESLVQKQLDIQKMLNNKYGYNDLTVFLDGGEELSNLNVDEYVNPYWKDGKNKPVYFIDNIPLYEFSIFENSRLLTFIGGNKQHFSPNEICEAFEKGLLFKVVDGSKVKVDIRPSFSWKYI